MAAHLSQAHMRQPSGTAHGGSVEGRVGPGRRAASCLLAFVALATLTWAAGAWWFSTHLTPGATVGGMAMGGMDAPAVAAAIESAAATYVNHVTGDGIDTKIAGSSVGVHVDGAAYANAIFEQVNPYIWPLYMVTGQSLSTPVEAAFDAGALAEVVGQVVAAANENATPPVNATAAWSDEAGAFEVVEPVAGTQVSVETATAAVAANVSVLEEGTVLGEAELVPPAVEANNEQLVAAIEKANAMAALSIPLVKDGVERARIGEAEVAAWAHVTDELGVAVDQQAMAEWAQGDLAASVAADDEVHVWAIDAAGTAAAVAAALDALSEEPIEVPMVVVQERPAESEGARERGRHVDVNLSTQYARFYEANGTVIWRSYIVSGNTSNGHGTPIGTYAVNSKQTNVTLVGFDEDEDGKPDYESKVRYWMPFLGGSYGFHDADWRSKFGGGIYAWNGSHGCVNLPVDAAADLFALIKVGDTVNIHW